MMPIDFPPPEIIEALEEQLDMDFVHFTVTLEGVVEGIFTNGFENQTVSFESKKRNPFLVPTPANREPNCGIRPSSDGRYEKDVPIHSCRNRKYESNR